MAAPDCLLCKQNRDVHPNSDGTHYCGRCNYTFCLTPKLVYTKPPCGQCGRNTYVNGPHLGGQYFCTACLHYFKPTTCGYYQSPLQDPVSGLLQKLAQQPIIPEGPLYLVVNNALQPMSLVQQGFIKNLNEEETALVNKEGTNTLAIPSKEIAIKFAEWLASKNNGQRFYLFELVDFVQTADPPLKWGKK